MSRSSSKGPYIDEKLFKKVLANKSGEVINTYSRRCQIAPEFVNKSFAVYNGKKFINVFVTEEMVGHRLGEFSPTRTFKGHGHIVKRLIEKT